MSRISDEEYAHLQQLVSDADLDMPVRMELEYSIEHECVIGKLITGGGVEAVIHSEETARLIEAALNALPLMLEELRKL